MFTEKDNIYIYLNELLYEKSYSHKPHLQDLPYDLHSNDISELNERKNEVIKRLDALRAEMYEKYPREFFDRTYIEDVDAYNYDTGMIGHDGQLLLDYYNELYGIHLELSDFVAGEYDNKLNELDALINNQEDYLKDLTKENTELNRIKDSLKSENDKLSKDFKKQQKEFLDLDDEFQSIIHDSQLITERNNNIKNIKETWDNVKDFTTWYESYLQEPDINFSIPLSDYQLSQVANLKRTINQQINSLDEIYSNNSILLSSSQYDTLDELYRNILNFSSYMKEPWEIDIDEIAYERELTKNTSIQINKLDMRDYYDSVKSKRDKVRNDLNNTIGKRDKNDSKLIEIDNNQKQIKHDKKRTKQQIQNIKNRKNNLKVNKPKKSDYTSKIKNVPNFDNALNFIKDLSKAHDYQSQLYKINEKLNEEYFDGIPMDRGL